MRHSVSLLVGARWPGMLPWGSRHLPRLLQPMQILAVGTPICQAGLPCRAPLDKRGILG